jgi:hypothetical protein
VGTLKTRSSVAVLTTPTCLPVRSSGESTSCQSSFSGGEEAKQAEDGLKQRFADCFEPLGGEFFLGDEIKMDAEFSQLTRSVSFVITAT